MQKILVTVAVLLGFGIGFMVGEIVLIRTQKPTGLVKQVVDRSLDKYTIPYLSKVQAAPANITITKTLKEYPNFTSSEFIMEFSPSLDGKNIKKVSGMINVPKNIMSLSPKGAPILVMIRGYVPSKDYFIGNGTVFGSQYFANNGFITVSPDFLGYGDSDKETDNVFESRFQTYTTVLSLLNSFNSIQGWDHKNVMIWAHSNGGQIALTTLEITGKDYPTALWAPVSSSFPFSILYYTDEADDKGKALRRELAKFENVYDSDLYSLTNYLDKIKAPIELNQGTADDAVPVVWSDNLIKSLKSNGLKPQYNIYPGANHEMEPSWNTAIQKDLMFFRENLR